MHVHNLMESLSTLFLSRAILLYEIGNPYSGSALATVHPIVAAPGDAPALPDRKPDMVPILGPGQLLTHETLDALLKKLTGLPQRRALLPENCLCADPSCMAWWTPQARRPLFFATRNKAFNRAVGGKDVLHPPLLFVACPGKLRVFALAADERPQADTPLCRAPYFNLYSDGSMCAGNTRLPEIPLPADIPLWETAFYETNFTHSNLHNRGDKLTLHSGGHDGLWKEMRKPTKTWKSGAEVFPAEHLVPLKLTVEEALNQ